MEQTSKVARALSPTALLRELLWSGRQPSPILFLVNFMHRRLLVITVILVAGATRLLAAQGFHWDSSVLYQPDEPLRARLSSVEELAAYMKRLDAVCAAFFASEKTPERLDIVVGLKPQKKVKVWFVSSRRSGQDKSLLALRKKLESVSPCSVHGGPIAFALHCTIAGASPSKGIPMPQEWCSKGEPVIVPDGVFERIWRD
jgi:hypothetical protein